MLVLKKCWTFLIILKIQKISARTENKILNNDGYLKKFHID